VAASRRTRSPTSNNEHAKRYQEAAEAALDQLTWTIAYLRRIGKPQIAKALEAKCAAIINDSQLKRGWRWDDDG
jgi:hypothetical protein